MLFVHTQKHLRILGVSHTKNLDEKIQVVAALINSTNCKKSEGGVKLECRRAVKLQRHVDDEENVGDAC